MQEARPTTIERKRPVGNYAYNIAFSDGHDSGIYTFEFLFELGRIDRRLEVAVVGRGSCGATM